jgi:ribosomal protein S18 acetylase RimI-like enzyme
MRGLRLFVRPIEPPDHLAISAFFERHTEENNETAVSHSQKVAACGLLGKLLGEIVAVAGLEIVEDAVRVRELIVARELRRKRIGKVMMREVEQLAVKMDRRRLIVDDAHGAQEFLRRVGFVEEGERWVRDVR